MELKFNATILQNENMDAVYVEVLMISKNCITASKGGHADDY